MANPAAMLALTEIRKREMIKYVENMSLHKIKAAAQANAGNLAQPVVDNKESESKNNNDNNQVYS
jgi:hypothetical protein